MIKHNEIMEVDKLRVNIIREIVDVQHERLASPVGWTYTDMEEILNFACVGFHC